MGHFSSVFRVKGLLLPGLLARSFDFTIWCQSRRGHFPRRLTHAETGVQVV
jgi:hypothetical protein